MSEEIICLRVNVFSGSGHLPIEGAHVAFHPLKPKVPPVDVVTGADGMATISLPAHLLDGGHLVVMALDHDPGFIQLLDTQRVEFAFHLRRYPPAELNLGWWHRLMGIRRYQQDRGSGMTIGVIDSGVAQHPDLRHVVDCGTFHSAGREVGSLGRDELNHGTGVAALLVARPESPTDYGGVVPGATLLSAKAFDHMAVSLTSGTQGEIQEALNYLFARGVDLVNCSFCSATLSRSLEDVIEDGYERGVLCVCAAGNQPSYVGFPARFRLAVAVSALGVASELRAFTPERDSALWRGDFFFPTFSARGDKIACCGPGVGLITAASMAAILPSQQGRRASCRVFGTSFASPLVCGILAAALAEDPVYLAMARDRSRADYALGKLKGMCRPIGFPPSCEGAGLPGLAAVGGD